MAMRHISTVLQDVMADIESKRVAAAREKRSTNKLALKATGSDADLEGAQSDFGTDARLPNGEGTVGKGMKNGREPIGEATRPSEGQRQREERTERLSDREHANPALPIGRSIATAPARNEGVIPRRPSAVVIDLLMVRAQRHAALRSNTGVSIRAKNS